MEVNHSYANGAVNQLAPKTRQKEAQAETKGEVKNQATEKPTVAPAYAYEPSKAEEKKETTYKPDMQTIDAMKKEAEEKTRAFRDMVEKLIMQQSGKASIAEWRESAESEEDLLLEIDEATRAAAEEAIGEDGYYGVEKTAQRILDFAKAISGGDPEKIEMLRGAVEKGFGAATKAFGKELPDVSQKTYEKVMQGFDDWANEHKSIAE